MTVPGPAPLEPDAAQRQVAVTFGGQFAAYQQAGFTRPEAFEMIQLHLRAAVGMLGSCE